MKAINKIHIVKNINLYKTSIILCFVLLSLTNLFAQSTNTGHVIVTQDPDYIPPSDSMATYAFPQVKPRFYENLDKYFADSIRYPDSAKKSNIQGTVFVSFIIERNGAISNVNILRSSSYTSIDNEAKRIISTMPNWTPGQQNGKPVRVSMMVPVHFKLPPSTDSTMKK